MCTMYSASYVIKIQIYNNKKRTPCKQKLKTRCLHWGILPNIQRTIYTYPPWTLPKDWRGGNAPKVILWSHHHPDSKTRWGHYQKRKLQANIFDWYRCKNSQQDSSKLNLRIHKKIIHHYQVGVIAESPRVIEHAQINQCDTPQPNTKAIWSSQQIQKKTFDKISA